jgi:hypothetical protein
MVADTNCKAELNVSKPKLEIFGLNYERLWVSTRLAYNLHGDSLCNLFLKMCSAHITIHSKRELKLLIFVGIKPSVLYSQYYDQSIVETIISNSSVDVTLFFRKLHLPLAGDRRVSRHRFWRHLEIGVGSI